MYTNEISIIVVLASILGYVLDERCHWTSWVEALVNRWPKTSSWSHNLFCILVIVLSFYCMGYLNGGLTLFSNDCPFGMQFQADRERWDYTSEEYNRRLPVLPKLK